MPAIILTLTGFLITQQIAIVSLSKKEIPAPKTFAAGIDGSITELYSLPAPPDGPIQLTNFAANAATNCLDLKPSNYEVRLQACKRDYFSEGGYNQFVNVLDGNGYLAELSKGQLILDSTLASAVNISEPGTFNREEVFTIEVPISLSEERKGRSSGLGAPKTVIVRVAKSQKNNSINQFKVVQFFLEARI